MFAAHLSLNRSQNDISPFGWWLNWITSTFPIWQNVYFNISFFTSLFRHQEANQSDYCLQFECALVAFPTQTNAQTTFATSGLKKPITPRVLSKNSGPNKFSVFVTISARPSERSSRPTDRASGLRSDSRLRSSIFGVSLVAFRLAIKASFWKPRTNSGNRTIPEF